LSLDFNLHRYSWHYENKGTQNILCSLNQTVSAYEYYKLDGLWVFNRMNKPFQC